MILNVVDAKYAGEYRVVVVFNNGKSKLVDLQETIFSDQRNIFQSLRNKEYFKDFKLSLNTITWNNEADFAPEFLDEIGVDYLLQK